MLPHRVPRKGAAVASYPTPIQVIHRRLRQALLTAAAAERAQAPFHLTGRGHEPRVSLCRRLSSLLRKVDLPCAVLRGYGRPHYYPLRVFLAAEDALREELGASPIELVGGAYMLVTPRLEARVPRKAGRPLAQEGCTAPSPDRLREILALKNAGRLDEAEGIALAGLADHPGFPPYWALLAELDEARECPEGAARMRNAARVASQELGERGGPNPGLDALEGYLHWRGARFEEALAALQRAEPFFPGDHGAFLHLMIGSCSLMLHRHMAARRHLERALASAPDEAIRTMAQDGLDIGLGMRRGVAAALAATGMSLQAFLDLGEGSPEERREVLDVWEAWAPRDAEGDAEDEAWNEDEDEAREDEEEEWTEDARACPYCEAARICDHLLLELDESTRTVDAGPLDGLAQNLKDALDNRVYCMRTQGHPVNPNLDGFNRLRTVIEEVADVSLTRCHEGGPGRSLVLSAHYTQTPERLEAHREALREWFWEGLPPELQAPCEDEQR